MVNCLILFVYINDFVVWQEEDLFDPANLAKYKKEIEEKRRLAQTSPGKYF